MNKIGVTTKLAIAIKTWQKYGDMSQNLYDLVKEIGNPNEFVNCCKDYQVN